MLGLIQKLGRFLLYGGFGGPKAYETKILEMTVAALSEPDAQSLARQIGLIERMQRWNEDRMVIAGFEDKALLPKLRNESEAHCLAKFRLKGEFGSVTAAVMTHRGVFSSLEFRPSPTKIKGHDFSVELVALHASDPGISSGIDAEEHARPVQLRAGEDRCRNAGARRDRAAEITGRRGRAVSHESVGGAPALRRRRSARHRQQSC